MSRTPEPHETQETQELVTVKLVRPTLIGGEWYDAGEEVDVYPFQKRHLQHYGSYIEGGPVDEDVFSPGERAHGAPNVLKRADERDDMDVAVSVDDMFDEHDVGQGAEGETVGEDNRGSSEQDNSSSSSSGSF